MKVIVRKIKLDALIKQLQKYNRSKEIDSYTVALHMSDGVFPTNMSVNICSMMQYLLERNNNPEAVYQLMQLCKIEIDDTFDYKIEEV